MASGEALGSYSSALVLREVAAIHVKGNSATTRNTARGSHSPKSRFCQVSSPTIAQSRRRTYTVSSTSRHPRTGTMLSATAEPSPILPAPMLMLRSEEHTSELQSRGHLVCRLLLEKKKTQLFNIKPTQKKTNRTHID